MRIFKFYNTLTADLQSFHPLSSPHVSLYTCGPTVYNYAHIGNFRTYIFEDLLKRSLQYFGYKVNHVMNITDIDDKTLKGAIENKVSLKDYTQPYTEAFLDDLKSLNILPADKLPKATDYIPQMIIMIQKLIDSQHAYQGPDGSIYFSISSFPSYGRLSNLENKTIQHGASQRVMSDEYDKDNPSDFVLWKAYDNQRDGSIYWESPFGKGRPGWHIECSVMASEILGRSIDIHCGGIDNMFPHHENEIAQCEACYKQTFSQFWLHSQHLLVEGKKMSKSLGNFFTLRDLIQKGFNPRAVRFVLASGHYRMPLNFTFEGLDAAKAALSRIDSVIDRLKSCHEAEGHIDLSSSVLAFEEAMLNDLNMPLALSALFDMIRLVNAGLDNKQISKEESHRILEIFKRFDLICGFIFHTSSQVPSFIIEMAERRLVAKKERNFKESDFLREEIKRQGYLIEDTPHGYRVTSL